MHFYTLKCFMIHRSVFMGAYTIYYNPQKKLKEVQDKNQIHAIKSILDILDKAFGLNFVVVKGSIVEVQLTSSGLAVIPRQLRDLPQLYKLQCPANKIRRLRNLNLCKSVKIINFSNNYLTTKGIQTLKASSLLKAIDFSMNQIDSLMPFNSLEVLESLDLNHNNIKEIPVISAPALHYLNLSNNPIES